MCPYHCEQLTQYSNVPQLELQGEGGGVGSVTAGNRPSTAQAPSATGRLGVWIPDDAVRQCNKCQQGTSPLRTPPPSFIFFLIL